MVTTLEISSSRGCTYVLNSKLFSTCLACADACMYLECVDVYMYMSGLDVLAPDLGRAKSFALDQM